MWSRKSSMAGGGPSNTVMPPTCMCEARPSLCRNDASTEVSRSRCCCAMGLAYTGRSQPREEKRMLVFFSGRRLEPGAWEQFRRAWMPGETDELPEGAVAIYHARNVKDEDEVISFGIFEGGRDDIQRLRTAGQGEEAELERQGAMAAFVENVPLEGIYEVIEEL